VLFRSTLSLKAPNLLLVEARPLSNGEGLFLYLRETEGKDAVLTLEELAARAPIRRMDEINVLEQPLQTGLQSVPFKPYEVRFVRAVLP
jgi:hypothetical protein